MCIRVTFPVLMVVASYIRDKVLVCKNHTPKHSGVMGHHVNKLLFSGSEKNVLVLFLQFLCTFEIVSHTHTHPQNPSCLEYYDLDSPKKERC